MAVVISFLFYIILILELTCAIIILSTSQELAAGGYTMAQLTCDASLKTIILNETFGITYYHSWDERQWGEVQSILSKFGITIPSKFTVNFEGKAYRLSGIPGFFGSRDVMVFYKDTAIAKATVEGPNYCDRETKLMINFSTLRSIYEA